MKGEEVELPPLHNEWISSKTHDRHRFLLNESSYFQWEGERELQELSHRVGDLTIIEEE
jgi:hypothetical protein